MKELPMPEDKKQALREMAESAKELLQNESPRKEESWPNRSAEANEPLTILVGRADELIDRMQQEIASSKGFFNKLRGKKPAYTEDEILDKALMMSAFWGEALIERFGWHWALLELEEDEDPQVAVISPDASLSVLPMLFIMHCFQDTDTDCTVALSYNMLLAGKLPSGVNPGDYVSLTTRVGRIVSRR